MNNLRNSNVVGTSGVMNSAMWNVIGRLAPIAATLLTIPPLIATLGPARWGVMTIALTLVGTFGIFDLGLGRALTRVIADDIGHGRADKNADLALSGILVLGGLGVVAAISAAMLTDLYVSHGLKIDAALRTETRDAIWILCATAPLVLINAALWGVISAYQEFRAANLLNIPINIFYYVGPLLALQAWNSLCAVMLSLAACRLVMTIGYTVIALRIMPSLYSARLHFGQLAPLWRIGGWMTASNITYPILGYCDRFLIGAMIPASFISFYTTPLDVVSRFSLITFAITGSAFPALARSFRVDPDNTRSVFINSTFVIAVLIFPICFGTAMLSEPLLAFWVGPEFAVHSSIIASILCFGVIFCGIDNMISGFIDAIGRPDLNAKFSILEIIIYLPIFVTLLHEFGLIGAAIAWVIRYAFDCIVRLFLATRSYEPVASTVWRIARLMSIVVIFTPFIMFRGGIIQDLILSIFGISLFIILFWTAVLKNSEKLYLLKRFKGIYS